MSYGTETIPAPFADLKIFMHEACMGIKKKIFYLLIVVALGAFLAKEITAERARGFIRECLSEHEIEIIIDEHADQKRQFEIVKRGIACVREKQSWPERIVTQVMGNRLFD